LEGCGSFFTWRASLGGWRALIGGWRASLGGWRVSLGGLHLEGRGFTWKDLLGGWRDSLGGLYLEGFTWRVERFTWWNVTHISNFTSKLLSILRISTTDASSTPSTWLRIPPPTGGYF